MLGKKISSIQTAIKYQFKDKNLLIEALTHKSYCIGENKKLMPNERLEFLGDALLGAITAEKLMVAYPKDNEGLLSKKRASIINQEVLAEKALKMSVPEYLIMGPGEKSQQSHLKPRLLASAFEAIIGAIYLDSNFGIAKAWVESQFEDDIKAIKPDLEFEKDYKTRLQEITIKKNQGIPDYILISMEGPSHSPEFVVGINLKDVEVMRASGKSKKAAEQKAAQMLMEQLDKIIKKKE